MKRLLTNGGQLATCNNFFGATFTDISLCNKAFIPKETACSLGAGELEIKGTRDVKHDWKQLRLYTESISRLQSRIPDMAN